MKIGKAMKISPAPAEGDGDCWRFHASEPDMGKRSASDPVSVRRSRGRKKLLLAAGMAALATSALIFANMPPRYVARSIVAADLRLSSGAAAPAAEEQEGSEALQAQLETEMQIIQSGSLLDALAGRMRLADDPEFGAVLAPSPLPRWTPHWLNARVADIRDRLWPGAGLPEELQAQAARNVSRHISVRPAEDANAVVISAWSADPDRAALMANTLAELYVQRVLDEKVTATERALSLLRGRLAQLQEAVNSAGGAIEQRQAEGDQWEGGKRAAAPEPPIPAQRAAAKMLDGRTPARAAAAEAGTEPPDGVSKRKEGQSAAAPGGQATDTGESRILLQLELQAAADRSRSLRRELAALIQQLGHGSYPVLVPAELRVEDAASAESHHAGQSQEGRLQENAPGAAVSILVRAERPEAESWTPKFVLLGFTPTAAAGLLLLLADRTRRRQAWGETRRDIAPEAPEGAADMDGGTNVSSPGEGAPEPAHGSGRGQLLQQAFTPANPQHSAARFVGRREQLARLRKALLEERTHVFLYGERGHGKTSLANLAAEAAREAGFAIARYSCTASSSFEDVLRGLARSLPERLLVSSPRLASGLMGCEAALPAGPLQPWHVLNLPGQLMEGRLLLLVDEFDRLPDDATRARVVDTIKLLSEHGASVVFLIVAASDSLEQLLDRHPSARQNILGVRLPLLTNADVEEIILRGGRHSRLDFSAQLRTCIVALARGVPYHAQLLALRAGQAALDRGDDIVVASDLRQAIDQSVAEATPQITFLYEGLTQNERAAPMTSLLRAMAAGEQDRFGRFRATTLPDGRVAIAGAIADPALWVRLVGSDAVRRCAGAGADIYRFAEPNFAHYVLLRMVRLVLGFAPDR